jgi:hypothetical protein
MSRCSIEFVQKESSCVACSSQATGHAFPQPKNQSFRIDSWKQDLNQALAHPHTPPDQA